MGSLYAKDPCKIAEDWLDYHEGSNNWNIFAKVLDDCGYYSPQTKQNIPWCAIFCNFCVLQACVPEDRDNDEKKWDAYYFQYQPSYWNLSAGAKEYADYFKNAGAWYDEPEVGDMCFFNVGDGIGHVGIVVDTEDYITTIEGNAGDCVQKKWYSYDEIGGKIAGFGRPRYDGVEDPSKVDHKPKEDDKPAPQPDPQPNPDKPCTVELETLSRGSTGEQVNTLKALLNEFGYATETYNGEPMPLDGDFDYDTEQAVFKFQDSHGLEQNGIVDERFWNLLLK